LINLVKHLWGKFLDNHGDKVDILVDNYSEWGIFWGSSEDKQHSDVEYHCDQQTASPENICHTSILLVPEQE